MKETPGPNFEIYNLIELLQSEVFELKGERVSEKEIFYALFIINHNLHNLETALDLWDLNLNLENTKDEILNFDFSILRQPIEIDSNIFPKGLMIMEKVRIKQSGTIWVIHKYDLDPFPSQPHAHQLDSNLKLDLSTGKLYKQKQYVEKIRKKDLLEIRKKAIEKNFTLPDLI